MKSKLEKRIRSLKSERGQSLVEFALVFPIFVLLVFSIIDFGYVFAQRGMFLQGCNHVTWNMTSARLGDMDGLDSLSTKRTFGTSVVAPLVYSELEEQSLFGFDANHLTVWSATAELYNEEGEFTVPGYADSSHVAPATNRTRYLDLTAEVTYDIYPITFVGELIFGKVYTVKQEISCTRILGSQHRSG